jgi:hypothetical protein
VKNSANGRLSDLGQRKISILSRTSCTSAKDPIISEFGVGARSIVRRGTHTGDELDGIEAHTFNIRSVPDGLTSMLRRCCPRSRRDRAAFLLREHLGFLGVHLGGEGVAGVRTRPVEGDSSE